MGCFSWVTSDTKKSIPASGNLAERPTFPVYLITEDGRQWLETDYEGYGVFGGKDIYSLIAELNDKGSDRDAGIDLVFDDNPCGRFEIAAAKGVKLPKLVERFSNINNFKSLPYPEGCEFQGYFYDDGVDEDYDY